METRLIEFVDRLSRASTPGETVEALGRVWRDAGFGMTFVVAESRLRRDDVRAVQPDDILGNWPEEEKRRYVEGRCWEFDPLLRHCTGSDASLHLHHRDFRRRPPRSERHRRVLEREFSWRWPARAVVPVRDARGAVWMFAAAGDLSPGELDEAMQVRQQEMRLTAWACEARLGALAAAKSVRDGPPVHLSARERACLLELSSGRRNERIAERLGIRPATVEMYLRRARHKLGAKTREQAVARAVAWGLLDP